MPFLLGCTVPTGSLALKAIFYVNGRVQQNPRKPQLYSRVGICNHFKQPLICHFTYIPYEEGSEDARLQQQSTCQSFRMRIRNSFAIGTHRFCLWELKCLAVSSFSFNTWYFLEFTFSVAVSGCGSLTAVLLFARFHFIQLDFQTQLLSLFWGDLWEKLSLGFFYRVAARR